MWYDVGIVQHLPTRRYTNKEGGHNVSCLIVTALQSRGEKKEKEKKEKEKKEKEKKEKEKKEKEKETWLLDFVWKLYSYHTITSRSKYDWVFTGISTL